MANQIIEELLIEADKADSLGKVKKALKDIKGQMIAIGDEGSDDFQKLSAAAAELKDKVEDANAAIDRANPDKFNGLASAAKIAATGIQLTTGAMQLFGSESEDVQKALLKVQAAMMFAEGLQNVKELKKEFYNLGNAIAANPIFTLVAVLTAIGAAAYKLYQTYQETNSEASKLKRIAEETKKVTDQQIFAAENELAVMQAKGATAFDIHKQEQKILDLKISNAKTAIAIAEATLRELKSQDTIYETILKTEAALLKKMHLTKEAAGVEMLLAQNQKERYGEAEEELLKQSNLLATLTNEAIVSDAKYNKIVVDNFKIANDEKVKDEEETQKRLAELREGYRREHMAAEFLQYEDFKKLSDERLKAGIITQDQYNEQLKAKHEELFGKFEAIERKGAETSLVVQQYVATERERIDKEEALARVAMAQEFNAALQDLTDIAFTVRLSKVKKGSAEEERILKQQFNINKALQLSMTAITGIQNGITAYGAGLKAASAGGITAIAAPAWGAAYAAISAVGTLASLAKIAATQFGGSGGSVNMGGGATPSLSALNTDPIPPQPSTQLDANGNVLNQQQQTSPAQRVYVLETDITNTQNQVSVIQNAARV